MAPGLHTTSTPSVSWSRHPHLPPGVTLRRNRMQRSSTSRVGMRCGVVVQGGIHHGTKQRSTRTSSLRCPEFPPAQGLPCRGRTQIPAHHVGPTCADSMATHIIHMTGWENVTKQAPDTVQQERMCVEARTHTTTRLVSQPTPTRSQGKHDDEDGNTLHCRSREDKWKNWLEESGMPLSRLSLLKGIP